MKIARATKISAKPRSSDWLSAHRFILGSGVIIALILVLGTAVIVAGRNDAIGTAERRAGNLGLILNANIGNVIDRVDLGLLAIRNEFLRQEQAGGIDPQAMVKFIAAQDTMIREVDGFRIYDADGRLTTVAHNAPPPSASYHTQPSAIKAHNYVIDQLILSPPFAGRATGRQIIVFVRVLSHPDGSYAGTVSGGIAVDRLSQMMGTVDFGVHGSGALYDSDLMMIARYPKFGNADNAIASPAITKATRERIVANGGKALFSYVSPDDDVKYIADFRRIGHYPLSTGITLSSKDYLADWWDTTRMIVAICGVLIVVVALAGRGLYRHERRNALAAVNLKTAEQRYRLLFERTPLPKWVIELPSLRILEVNDAAVQHYGYSHGEFLSLTLADIRTPESAHRLIDQMPEAKSGLLRGETQHRTKDGRIIDIEFFSTPIEFDGRAAVLVSLVDITDRKFADRAQALAHQVFVHAREAIMVTDARQSIIDVNPAFVDLTGYNREEVLGQTPRILRSGVQDDSFYRQMWNDIVSHGYWRGEMWDRRKNGEIYAQIATIAAVKNQDGMAEQYVGVLSDITSLKRQESELRNQAFLDPLTKLPNRLLLADRLHRALIRSKRHQGLLAVCFIDLDGFKPINDTMGHEVGDQILAAIAQRIQSTLREEDTVARIGGDEFVVLMTDIKRWEECEIPVERIAQAIRAPIEAGNTRISVSASIGIAIAPEDGDGDDLLLRRADMAMYVAKQQGRDRHVYYRADMTVTAPQAAEGSKR